MLDKDRFRDLVEFCDNRIEGSEEYLRSALLGTEKEFLYELDLQDTTWFDYGIYKYTKDVSNKRMHLYVDLSFFEDTIKNANAVGHWYINNRNINNLINNTQATGGFQIKYRPHLEDYKVLYHIISTEIAKQSSMKAFNFTFKDNDEFIYETNMIECDLDIFGATYEFGRLTDKFGDSAIPYDKFHNAILHSDYSYLHEDLLKDLKSRNVQAECRVGHITYYLSCDDFSSELMKELCNTEYRKSEIYIGLIVNDTPKEDILAWFKSHLDTLEKLKIKGYSDKDKTILVYFLKQQNDFEVGPGVYIYKDNQRLYHKRLVFSEVYLLPGFTDYYTMYVNDRVKSLK